MSKIEGIKKIHKLEKGWVFEADSKANLRKAIAQFAQANGLLVLTLRVEEKSLEEVFKELTK